ESKIVFTIKFKRDTPITVNEPAIELKGSSILLVDDNLTSQQALTKMLYAMGCHVKAVASGAEVHPAVVLGLITNSPFRVVLLDMDMLVMDGESVLRALRQDDLTRNTKVIVLTSIGQRKKLDSISKLDYSNYLFKPVRRSELREVLVSTLGLQQGIHRGNNPMKTEEVSETRGVQSLKILLVDDDEASLKLGTIFLGHLGCSVDTAFSGTDAVAAVETRDYDLVFMDVQIHEISGLETTRRIRALKNDRKNVPIIAMTAHDMTLYEQRCLEAGMDDYICKFFNIKHITQIIKACTEGHYGKGLRPAITPECMTGPVETPLLDVAMGILVFDNDAVRYDHFLKGFMESLPKWLEKMTIALSAEAWELL
ncbi:MAG: response regulator, partial [Chloroflexi bacterium]|nr:response regulator [Chloroflexota bacterium]